MKLLKRVVASAFVLASAFGLQMGSAYAEDSPDKRISALYDNILATMKEGKSLGFDGRYKKLSPAVAETLDLPTMTRFAVGPRWSAMSASDQSTLVAAFTRMTVSTYAHNFDQFDGERFSVDSNVQERGPDRLVTSQIAPKSGEPVTLTYRMRESGGEWKVIDVYYRGSISELTTRRSDFASSLDAGGAQGLIAHLNQLADDLSK